MEYKLDIDSAKKVYEKLHNGDPITNGELDNAIMVFSIVVEFLEADIKLFLASSAIRHDLQVLTSYKISRKISHLDKNTVDKGQSS